MPTVLQLRRGTTGQNNSFTGAAGELTMNTDLKTVVVHDNSTAGGHTLVMATATQTLTNKTLTAPTINSITKNGSNGTGDIGQSDNKYGTIYGQATSAQYADLAEKYTTDQEYEAGTVVVFGGESEVTQSTSSHDRKVAGVVSTAPAFQMNSDAEGQYIALQGRVPCKVMGPIEKGDLVVTSTAPGVGAKLDDTQYLPGQVIGKALETIEDEGQRLIEVVVGRL
jgi:hypothetical protein